MRGAFLSLALLLALPAAAQHKPWYQGNVGTGAVQWTPPGISRDGGSAFPLVTNSTTPGASVSTTVTTTTATTMIVVAVAWGNATNSTVQHPVTVTWSGGTGCATAFTKQVEGAFTGTGANVSGSSIWTAACSSTAVGRSIVVTPANADAADSVAVAVDALVGASTTVGTSGSSGSASGSIVVKSFTLSGVVAGSWIYVATTSEVFPLTPVDSFTVELAETAGTNNLACGVGTNTVGASGSVTVGWQTSTAWTSAAALEIRAQ